MMNVSDDASVCRYLTADHTRLDIVFEQACRAVRGGDVDAGREQWRQFADGLARHIAVEEHTLFPVFDAIFGMPGPTTVMRHEHRKLEQLVSLGSAALDAREAPTFATAAAELATILQAHNLKEERVLYPRADAALDPAARAKLVAALDRG